MEQELEMNRYSRQIMLPEFGSEGQMKLKNAKVLVIGAGGLGCPVLQYLAASGIGQLGIVDNDQVDVSNLHRQILYNTSDIGFGKASTAAKKLEVLNPFVKTKAYEVRLDPSNAEDIFQGYDLVIDGSDNFATRYLVNDTCVKLGIPLVFGSILKFEGQVAVFNFQNGPQYRDLFPEPPPRDEVPNCSEIGVIGILPGLIGMYMANEAIKLICGMGTSLSGKLLLINSLTNTTHIFNIPKNEALIISNKSAEIRAEIPEMDYPTFLSEQESDPDAFVILDVRGEEEFESRNIGGINIPLQELPNRVGELPQNKRLLVCCQSGVRSKSAVSFLMKRFRGNVFSLSGGISSCFGS